MFASLARANERVRVQNVTDFPQTKLDSEVNARFLVNEHGDPHFLFHKFNKNNILNNWEKKKSVFTVLVYEKRRIYFAIELSLREISGVLYVHALICAR